MIRFVFTAIAALVAACMVPGHAIAEEVADGLQEGEMDRRVTWLEGEGS